MESIQSANLNNSSISSYDDAIEILDAKHNERIESLQKAIREIQDAYIIERSKLVADKAKKEIIGSSSKEEYLDGYITIKDASKFISRSAGWIYEHKYIVEEELPTEEKTIPCHKAERNIYFTRRELQVWLSDKINKRKQTIEQKAKEYLMANPRR